MDFTWNDLWAPDKHLKRSKSGKESQKSALKMATEASIAQLSVFSLKGWLRADLAGLGSSLLWAAVGLSDLHKNYVLDGKLWKWFSEAHSK